MHSLAIGKYGGGHRYCNKMKEEHDDYPHHALEDVRVQAKLFFEITNNR